jgi:cobalt-zinc-cadmium efflux system outer membrane protein
VRGAPILVAACVALLSGCATYHPLPLPPGPDLRSAAALSVPARQLALPGLPAQTFDPARGLTQINLITLAVADDPQLQAARLRAGIARAQLLQAGLLPDPQLAAGLSKSSFLTGYSVALSEEIRALATRGAAERAARAHLRQVNLEILWQEWQVAERARELFIASRTMSRLRRVLDRQRRLLARVYRRDEGLLAHRDVTAGEVSADFIAWNSVERQWRAWQLDDNRTRHALDALLGLSPHVRLRLVGTPAVPAIPPGQYHSALTTLAHRRPDLLALQAGYRSEQERLREAIIAQFPLIDAGVQRARDPNDGVQSVGFNVTVTLPLFNRNRGPIATRRATRRYLRQIYQARLDAASNQADEIRQSIGIMRGQLARLDRRSAALERAAVAARMSLELGADTLRDYARLQSNALQVRAERIRLGAALARAQGALATLLALPL